MTTGLLVEIAIFAVMHRSYIAQVLVGMSLRGLAFILATLFNGLPRRHARVQTPPYGREIATGVGHSIAHCFVSEIAREKAVVRIYLYPLEQLSMRKDRYPGFTRTGNAAAELLQVGNEEVQVLDQRVKSFLVSYCPNHVSSNRQTSR